jgi:hypothetical protein
MKRDILYKLFRQGVVTDIWIVSTNNIYCLEYRLNDGTKGRLEGFDKKTGVRKFRSVDAACNVAKGLGVDPIRVFNDINNGGPGECNDLIISGLVEI